MHRGTTQMDQVGASDPVPVREIWPGGLLEQHQLRTQCTTEQLGTLSKQDRPGVDHWYPGFSEAGVRDWATAERSTVVSLGPNCKFLQLRGRTE